LNIDVIEAAISYFAKMGTAFLYKTKLMKMLWYSAVLTFINHGKSMTGMVYIHETMGALPIGHYSLMNLEYLNIKEETGYNYDSMLRIFASEKVDYSVLNAEQKAILDRVIAKFKY